MDSRIESTVNERRQGTLSDMPPVQVRIVLSLPTYLHQFACTKYGAVLASSNKGTRLHACATGFVHRPASLR